MVLLAPALILAAPAHGLAKSGEYARVQAAVPVAGQVGVRTAKRSGQTTGVYTRPFAINCSILTEAARARICGGETVPPKSRKKPHPAD
jgi:hypothetical protein